jgi:AraC family transcriptional regulator
MSIGSIPKLLFLYSIVCAHSSKDLIMRLQEHGQTKYGAEDLLVSSAVTGWRGIVAEHRHHPRGELPSFQPQHMEIGVATGCHPDCVVSRTGDRVRQHTRVEAGTIWLCPVGVLEEDIQISAWHEVLHLYLPPERFAQLSEARGGAAVRPEAIPYLGGIYHERIRRIGKSLLDHLLVPGSAGSVLVDTLSLELTACVVDEYSGYAGNRTTTEGEHRLDSGRLRRVLDYMTAHLDEDISLDDLADAACFSAFHFSRVFSNTLGVSPHRYLSRLRLERAKTMLSLRTLPISQISLACCFSSQSNFTRAFRRATGSTPQAYRRQSA